MKRFTTPLQKTGLLGEDLACRWLLQKGFTLIDRNVSYPCGEIDIIASKDGCIHFIEVKASQDYASSETMFNPLENITKKKLQRFITSVKLYLSKNPTKHYSIDALALSIKKDTLSAKVQYIENIHIV
jgi:putative endonuclease